MKNKKLVTGSLLAATLMIAACSTAFAMPSDIQEAVNSGDYSAYEHVNGYSDYSDSELISIGENYVATAEAMIRQSPFGTILGSVTPGTSYYVIGECPDCMWYKISGPVTGYVYAQYLIPGSNYNNNSGSNSGSAVSNYVIRDLDMMMEVTDAPSVNVRTAPTTASQVVAIAQIGEEIHVTGNVLGTEYYQCSYEGQTVYICDDYLTPEFPQTMACTVQGAVLNVHSAADVNAPIIGILNHGDKIRVSSVENDFLKFSLDDGRIAYVSDEYMAAIQ